jgi:hypothetical protein
MMFSVVINSGSILLLSTTLSPAVRQDVLDTVLLAQLAADEDFSAGSTHAQWTSVLTDTLDACGWKIYDQGRTSGVFPVAGVSFFSVYEALHAAFQSRLPAEQVVLIASALDRVAQLPEQSVPGAVLRGQSIRAIETQSAGMEGNNNVNSNHRVRMLAGIVEPDGYLTLASVCFETDQPIDSQFLRQDLATSRLVGELSTAFFYARFSVDQYEPYREDTVLWLGHQRQALSIEIDGRDLQNIR